MTFCPDCASQEDYFAVIEHLTKTVQKHKQARAKAYLILQKADRQTEEKIKDAEMRGQLKGIACVMEAIAQHPEYVVDKNWLLKQCAIMSSAVGTKK